MRRNWKGILFSSSILILIFLGWARFGSLDRAFRKAFFQKIEGGGLQKNPLIDNWTTVDGVRWFRIVGTDSSGAGFDGWISELSIFKAPPAPAGPKTFLQKALGLPSPEEQAKSLKQLRQLGDTLKKQLDLK